MKKIQKITPVWLAATIAFWIRKKARHTNAKLWLWCLVAIFAVSGLLAWVLAAAVTITGVRYQDGNLIVTVGTLLIWLAGLYLLTVSRQLYRASKGR